MKPKQKVLNHLKEQSARLNKVWYFCSAQSLANKLKIPRRSVSRYLIELEDEGLIMSKIENKKKYDKTKCYQVLNWSPWMPCALDHKQEKELKRYMDTHQPPNLKS